MPKAEASVKFRCPTCNNYISAHVVDSHNADGGYRRVRSCESCGERFATIERVDSIVKRRKVSG